MPTAWELARQYRWLLKRFGLEEVAKRTRVSIGGLRRFLAPPDTGGYHNPLTGDVWLRRWKGDVEDVAKLIHELMHRVGFGEPAAYYMLFRALNEAGQLRDENLFYARHYRVLVKMSDKEKMSEILAAGSLLALGLILAAHKNPSVLLSYLPPTLIWVYALVRAKMAHSAFGQTRFVRWALKRGLELNKEDLKKFLEGREKELRWRERIPQVSHPSGVELALDEMEKAPPEILWKLLPYYDDWFKFFIWRRLEEHLEKIPPEKREKLVGKLILSTKIELPHSLFKSPR